MGRGFEDTLARHVGLEILGTLWLRPRRLCIEMLDVLPDPTIWAAFIYVCLAARRFWIAIDWDAGGYDLPGEVGRISSSSDGQPLR